jgi:hypothetical protein
MATLATSQNQKKRKEKKKKLCKQHGQISLAILIHQFIVASGKPGGQNNISGFWQGHTRAG